MFPEREFELSQFNDLGASSRWYRANFHERTPGQDVCQDRG